MVRHPPFVNDRSTRRSVQRPMMWLMGASLAGITAVVPNAVAEEGEKDGRTPQEKMLARFPQPAKVSYLIGLSVIDENSATIGHLRRVVKTRTGNVLFIIDYGGGWFGFTKRLVAAPIEVCAMLGKQVAPLDMPRAEFDKAPNWARSDEADLPGTDTILVAVTRR